MEIEHDSISEEASESEDEQVEPKREVKTISKRMRRVIQKNDDEEKTPEPKPKP